MSKGGGEVSGSSQGGWGSLGPSWEEELRGLVPGFGGLAPPHRCFSSPPTRLFPEGSGGQRALHLDRAVTAGPGCDSGIALEHGHRPEPPVWGHLFSFFFDFLFCFVLVFFSFCHSVFYRGGEGSLGPPAPPPQNKIPISTFWHFDALGFGACSGVLRAGFGLGFGDFHFGFGVNLGFAPLVQAGPGEHRSWFLFLLQRSYKR